jgi:aspartate/methionine/tyrosine aminotransferase
LRDLQLKLVDRARGPPEASAKARGLEWIADLFLSVNTPVQLALPRLLAVRRAFRENVARRLGTNLARLRDLGSQSSGFAVLEGEGGWSAVIATPAVAAPAAATEAGGEEFALAALRHQDVLLHPGHFYDFPHDGHVVASLLPQPEIFAEAVRRLGSLSSREDG